MVTIKDVAREAGVAVSTVSNVLNNVDVVAPETRQKVMEVAARLKYVPNMNAKFLKSRKNNTLGLFLPSIAGDFYKLLCQAIHLQFMMQGYLLNIYISNENTSEEIYGMIISSGVQGAIVLNERLTDDYIERIARTNMPMVFIDREIVADHMSSILIDNVKGASQATEYLIKQGHRRIGYMHGVMNYDDITRFQAFCDVMKKYQLPIDENIILRGYFEEAIAYSETRVMLVKGIELPDAIFCANDQMALGCIKALNEVGAKVPDKVSVVGFDDNPLAQYYKPALTTIHSPVTELGIRSADELMRLVQNPDPIQGILTRLSPELVIRDSCRLRLS